MRRYISLLLFIGLAYTIVGQEIDYDKINILYAEKNKELMSLQKEFDKLNDHFTHNSKNGKLALKLSSYTSDIFLRIIDIQFILMIFNDIDSNVSRSEAVKFIDYKKILIANDLNTVNEILVLSENYQLTYKGNDVVKITKELIKLTDNLLSILK